MIKRITRLAVSTFAAALLLSGVAHADIHTNAISLLTTRCVQSAGQGCHGVALTNSGVSIYAPPSFPAGSKRYTGRFGGWAQYLGAAWTTCTIQVRPTSSASGTVTC